MAFVWSGGDQLVARLQPDLTTGPVEVAPPAPDGQEIEACLGLELQLPQHLAVGRRPCRHRHPHHHFFGIAERQRQDRVELLTLLDEPDHLLGGVADLLGRLAQVDQAAQPRGVEPVLGRPQDPELETLLHLVQAILEVVHLCGQSLVSQHQGRVRQAHRHLGHVLHLDQRVDGPVEVGHGRVLGGLRRLPRGSSCQPAQLGDPGGRALEEQHVAGPQHLVALDVGDPFVLPPDGDHPHPHLDR